MGVRRICRLYRRVCRLRVGCLFRAADGAGVVAPGMAGNVRLVAAAALMPVGIRVGVPGSTVAVDVFFRLFRAADGTGIVAPGMAFRVSNLHAAIRTVLPVVVFIVALPL